MAVGASSTKADVDSAAAQIARQVFAAADSGEQFNTWLGSVPDTYLTGLGYSTADVALLRAAFADLHDLRVIFTGGTPSKTLPYDYTANVRQLLGVGLY